MQVYISIETYSESLKLPCKMFRSNGALGNASIFFEEKYLKKYKVLIEHLGANARHCQYNNLYVLTFPTNSFLSILVE